MVQGSISSSITNLVAPRSCTTSCSPGKEPTVLSNGNGKASPRPLRCTDAWGAVDGSVSDGVVTSHQDLAQISLIAGVILLVVTVKCSRWIREFANAYISVYGTRLVISKAHSDYVRAALALGAQPHTPDRTSV